MEKNLLFLKKKKQKDFSIMRDLAPPFGSIAKVFLFPFLQKKKSVFQ